MSKYSFPARDFSWATKIAAPTTVAKVIENLDTLKLLNQKVKETQELTKELYQAKVLLHDALQNIPPDVFLAAKISSFLGMGTVTLPGSKDADNVVAILNTANPTYIYGELKLSFDVLDPAIAAKWCDGHNTFHCTVPYHKTQIWGVSVLLKTTNWTQSQFENLMGEIGVQPIAQKPTKFGDDILANMDFGKIELAMTAHVLSQGQSDNWKALGEAMPKKTPPEFSEVYAVDGKISLDPAGYKPPKVGNILYLVDFWVEDNKFDMSAYKKLDQYSDAKVGVTAWKYVGVPSISASYVQGQIVNFISKQPFQIGEHFHSVSPTWVHGEGLKSFKNLGKVKTEGGDQYKWVKINEEYPDAPTEPLPPAVYVLTYNVGKWHHCPKPGMTGAPVADGEYVTFSEEDHQLLKDTLQHYLEGYKFIHKLPGGHHVYKKMKKVRAKKPITDWMILNGKIVHPEEGKAWEIGDEIVLTYNQEWTFPVHWLAGWQYTGLTIEDCPKKGATGYIYRWVGLDDGQEDPSF